jgi:thymidylate synthase
MKKWPVYFKERLWRGDKNGDVGIATLWTPKENIVEGLSLKAKKRVAVVGQLYSLRGGEYIFRNIWANPRIRYVIVTGTDLNQSSGILLDLKIRSKKLEELLDKIPKIYQNMFWRGVDMIDMRGKSIKEINQKIIGLKKRGRLAKEKIFPENRLQKKEFISESSVFRVEGETIGEAWLQILRLITKFGRKIPRIHVYGGHERILLNVATVITNENIKEPKFWPYFEFGKEQLKSYFKNFFTPKREEEAYTYGERLFAYEVGKEVIDQVGEMTKKMLNFNYNKGAVAVLWQPAVDNFPVRKPWRTPCLTLIQGMCLEDNFFLTAYFRSNDMFGAWPQNAFALRKLQSEIATKLGKKTGDLTIISNCAFIDETDLAIAEQKVSRNNQMFCKFEPRGSLLVEVKNNFIVVTQVNPEGKTLGEFRVNGKEPKAAEKMIDQLLQNEVISRIDHAVDVGVQIGRAEEAVKLGLIFEQDKNLKSSGDNNQGKES